MTQCRRQPFPARHRHLPHRPPVPHAARLGRLGDGPAERTEGRHLSAVGPGRDRLAAFPFTMNWQMTRPGKVRFEKGEPFCFHHPGARTRSWRRSSRRCGCSTPTKRWPTSSRSGPKAAATSTSASRLRIRSRPRPLAAPLHARQECRHRRRARRARHQAPAEGAQAAASRGWGNRRGSGRGGTFRRLLRLTLASTGCFGLKTPSRPHGRALPMDAGVAQG